jgi:hypothetical protein
MQKKFVLLEEFSPTTVVHKCFVLGYKSFIKAIEYILDVALDVEQTAA